MSLNEQENYEGSVIIQTVVSHNISWQVTDGNIIFRPDNNKCKLHQVDVFPDLGFNKGEAESTYVVYTNPVHLNALLERIDQWFRTYFTSSGREIKEPMNYTVTISTDNIVYRGLSDVNEDNRVGITFKASTDFVKKFGDQQIDNWNNINMVVTGNISSGKLMINTESTPNIKNIIDGDGNLLIEQVLPSLQINFEKKAN